ncbi:MAG: hypothetical protein FWF00_01745 [Endomicrobia bacterium]|nr:hypothetical protein [Endomicrobiia bacterium]MCL2506398.1 hypothetical protein [Endomicrobiia bacterium]
MQKQSKDKSKIVKVKVNKKQYFFRPCFVKLQPPAKLHLSNGFTYEDKYYSVASGHTGEIMLVWTSIDWSKKDIFERIDIEHPDDALSLDDIENIFN